MIDSGIDNVCDEGVPVFLPSLIEKCRKGDTVLILDTFPENSRIKNGNGDKLHTSIGDLLYSGVNIHLIGLAYEEDLKDVIATRARLSLERRNYITNLHGFWEFVYETMAASPNMEGAGEARGKVIAKEIDFVPSVSAYLRMSGDGKPVELFFSPIIAGDSDITQYFHVENFKTDLPLPKRVVEYISMCDGLSRGFDPKRWEVIHKRHIYTDTEMDQIFNDAYQSKIHEM